MPFAFQRRRGTTAQHASFTGLLAELTVDTDKKTVVVHDGSTAGGVPLARAAGGTLADTIVKGLEEDVNVVASAATGTINFDVSTASIWYYTSKGKKEAKEYAKKTGKKMVAKPMKKSAKRGK